MNPRRARPAAVSTAVSAVVTGPRRDGRVLASFPKAVYLLLEEPACVVALVTPDAVRLPNALVVASGAGEEPFAPVAAGAPVRVAEGYVAAGDVVVAAASWWEPVPRLGPVDASTVPARMATASRRIDYWTEAHASDREALRAGHTALAEAAARADPVDGAVAAGSLVGLGPGLTPAGDDLIGGTLASSRLLGDAVGSRAAVAFAQAVGESAAAHSAATSLVSAALLHHARRGAVADRVAALLQALVGRGDPDTAVADLLAVGHTSGNDLATGVLLGCRAALAVSPSTG